MSARTQKNSNNTSGYLGVNWSKSKKKWHAKLGVRYRRLHLGYFDDPEDAQTLKTLIEATGATCLDYIDETECCGAPSVGVSDKIALQLARDKLNHIKMVDAQALITICPFCHIMYDTNELRIEKTFNEVYGIPILHYPQLLGLAMGMTPEELAFGDLRVSAQKITQQFTKEQTNRE